MSQASLAADDALFKDPVLLAELVQLRIAAVNKRIDLTDCFSEYGATGKDANLGVMAKNRFRAAMGTIFKGAGLTASLLNRIVQTYVAGDPDPAEPGTGMRRHSARLPALNAVAGCLSHR